MACETVKMPGGGAAIVCSRGPRRHKRCHHCGLGAPFLCDWKTGKHETCDIPICPTHAQEVAPEKHLCPAHQASYKQWLAQREKAG